MEDGIRLGSCLELVLLTFWPKEVVPTIATSDDGSALGGRVSSVPLVGRLQVDDVVVAVSLARKPESSLPNHMYVVG
jgi:hypothetical protein